MDCTESVAQNASIRSSRSTMFFRPRSFVMMSGEMETIRWEVVDSLTYTKELQIVKRKKMVEDFCQEALIWTQLSHPNVLQLLGVNTTLFKTDFCLVSPWMVNGDIITFLNRTPDHDRLQSIREIVAGLEYLHSRSPVIVHGDIKGANILVDEDCNCRLADFGLSRETPGTTMFETSTGGMKGSLRWMAPEMFQPSTTRDSNEDRSPRDIYAYACTIVEIMTGRPPFPGLLDVVVMTQVLLNRARPERPTGVWCPDNVWELVEKCWDQDRLKRPTATYIHNYLSGLTETDSSLDAVPPVSAISHHEASVPIFPRTISLTALEQAINEDIIILNPSLIQPILDDPSPNVNPRFTDNILTQNNAFRKPESRVRSRSFTQYLTKLVPNTTLATTSLQTDDDSHWEQSSFYENVLGTPTLDKRPSIQPGAKFVQNYFTKLVPASKRLYSTAVAIARSFEDPFENVLRPPPDETPKQAAERIAREVEAKRVSDAIDAQLRGEWMRGRDDDFEAFLRPPPSETVEQATERVEREAEARKVSDAIDAELRAEWNRVQEERKAVNSLLLVGLAGSGKTTVLKNFIARYDSATWDTERSIWCTVIKLNVISLLLDLVDWICSDIQALQTDDGEPHDDKSTVHGFASRHLLLINPLKPLHQLTPVPVLQRALAEHVRSKHLWFSTGFPDPDQEPSDISLERSIIENAFKTVVANKDSIKALWEDENVQKAFKCRTIRGSPGFFLEHLDRITSATYFPTDDDLLHAYLPTRGHQDYRFLLDGKRILRITDLEGNRAQRYLLKSILLQEHYDTVIFLCPICTFDEVLEEDHSVNHLEESILLWRAICSIETLN
ncbi:hypothetical protein E1B28_006705 [Marasmius oreades]|uniref:Protein kinase domain-containing protein n=1 Tax=Marasmius oreades TaxID=181124 RepID=A0A9P7UWP1_9AGAR|nr:uncharacterized protein E1B28_006705 [Marasmius oreades]KAG7096023.1 hypothetical protein E1B28_006705 [Marasmius oreades]